MVFLTEVLGAEVVDIYQRRAGSVRDVTVRSEEPYPVVTGVVISRRPDVVIPWSEVRTFAAREVALRHPRDDVEKLTPDPHDLWLARDVLDRQIVDTDGRRVVRVNDLQLTESAGNLLLVAADIGIRGIFRRLGIEGFVKWLTRIFHRDLPMVLVSWDVVDPLRDTTPDQLRIRISGKRIAKLHPADIADIVEELGARERQAIFESLTEDIAADTLEEMEREDQVSMIESLEPQRASEILSEMSPDDVADILRELPEDHAREILRRMEQKEATDVEGLLRYGEETAGGLMTTEFISVTEDLTADECMKSLRELESEVETVYYIYVVDAGQHLIGVLSLRDLIVAPADQRLEHFMVTDVIHVELETELPEIAAVLSKYNLLAVPVVDDEYRLRGIVTVDDVLDQVLPESVKDRLPALR
jgi:CBS domain-containing protein